MRARVVSTGVIGTALAVLCGLGASGSLADDAIAGDLGPIRQWVAQNDGVPGAAAVRIGPVRLLQTPLVGRNHAKEGAIVGAVVLGVMGGLYFGAIGGLGCDTHPDERCDEALGFAVLGAAGGALVGGAVGALVGSQFETVPSMPVLPPPPGTRVAIVPRRGGVGIALSHSF